MMYLPFSNEIQAAYIQGIFAVISASITIFAGWLVLKSQLKIDRQKRKIDLDIGLKKDLYFDVLENLSLLNSALVNYSNLEYQKLELDEIIRNTTAKIQRIHLVGNKDCIEYLTEFSSNFLKAFLDIAMLRSNYENLPEGTPSKQRFGLQIEMLDRVMHYTKDFQSQITEILIALRNDLGSPIYSDNEYRILMDKYSKTVSEMLEQITNQLKELIRNI